MLDMYYVYLMYIVIELCPNPIIGPFLFKE